MNKFTGNLQLELMVDPQGLPLLTRQGRQLYKLLSDFGFGSVTAKAGFITDLASFPQWALVLLGECAQQPAVIHDWLYSCHNLSRFQSDNMLYQMCLVTGLPKWKAGLIYTGVRLGGWLHW